MFQASVSTGMQSEAPSPNGIPTETPLGHFRVQTKMPSRHMGDGAVTDDVEAYELPGVPWVCFFHKDGIALHGTYWHNNFGRRMSHGCVNLTHARCAVDLPLDDASDRRWRMVHPRLRNALNHPGIGRLWHAN